MLWNGKLRITVFLPDGDYILSHRLNTGWTDNSNNETKFKIDRRKSGTPTWTLINEPVPNSTSYSDNGLTPTTKYYYTVTATEGQGDSAPSNVATVTTSSLVDASTYDETNFMVSFSTVLNQTYLLESKDSFAQANWDILDTVIGDGNSLNTSDSGASRLPKRYYRPIAVEYIVAACVSMWIYEKMIHVLTHAAT